VLFLCILHLGRLPLLWVYSQYHHHHHHHQFIKAVAAYIIVHIEQCKTRTAESDCACITPAANKSMHFANSAKQTKILPKYSQPLVSWSTLQVMSPEPLFILLIHMYTRRHVENKRCGRRVRPTRYAPARLFDRLTLKLWCASRI